MEKAMEAGKWLVAHWAEVLGAVSALLSALIALFMLIPGEQPEKALKAIVDVIAKLSRKPE